MGAFVAQDAVTSRGKNMWVTRRMGSGAIEVYEKIKPYLTSLKRKQAERVFIEARRLGYLSLNERHENTKKRIYDLVKDEEGIATGKIARKSNLAYRDALRILNELKAEGLLEKTFAGRGLAQRWSINQLHQKTKPEL